MEGDAILAKSQEFLPETNRRKSNSTGLKYSSSALQDHRTSPSAPWFAACRSQTRSTGDGLCSEGTNPGNAGDSSERFPTRNGSCSLDHTAMGWSWGLILSSRRITSCTPKNATVQGPSEPAQWQLQPGGDSLIDSAVNNQSIRRSRTLRWIAESRRATSSWLSHRR